jgi:hypothetical protein
MKALVLNAYSFDLEDVEITDGDCYEYEHRLYDIDADKTIPKLEEFFGRHL